MRLPGLELRRLQRDPLGFLTERAREQGDLAFFRFGPYPACLVTHPELAHEVLVARHRSFHKGIALQRARVLLGDGLLTSEEEAHARHRRLLAPAFHRARVAEHAAVVVEEAESMAAGLAAGCVVDVAAKVGALTLRIVARALFAARLDGEADALGRAVTDALTSFDAASVLLSPLLLSLPLPPARRFVAARARLERTVTRLVAERRADGVDHGDLLSLLALSRDGRGRPLLSTRQVRDETMTFLLAGHETTANAVAWTLALLACNRPVEARLHDELDAVLQGRPPNAADVERLRYTRCVLSESMRLFPPAWMIGRRAVHDLELGGRRVRRGTVLLVPPYLLHRDPRQWPEPERFDPDRFSADADGRHRLAYLPFGAGPRQCIGSGFAVLESLLLLAVLLRARRFRLDARARLEPLPRITLRPRYGLPMRVEGRRR